MAGRPANAGISGDPRALQLRLRDLMTVNEVADMAGVLPATIHTYRREKFRERYQVPEPVAWVNGIPLWQRSAVAAWMETRPGAGFRTDLHGDERIPA